jgi:hypothetical protein
MQGHRLGLPTRGSLALLAFAALVLIPGAGAMTMSNGSNGGLPELNVLSNRADLVSGGDALVQVVLPARVDPSTVRVSVDGKDVTSAFAVRPGGAYEGVVTGLANGANDLMATMRNGPTVHLTVTNHRSGGPIFAGAQVQPWICKTVTGFPVPTNAQCDGAPLFTFQYMDAATHTFKPYTDAVPAASIAMTTTDRGVSVPYIVRLERGAMDRGLYDVAVLADPAGSWAPWASQRGWNHKVLYQFGGGTAPWHTNGAPSSDLIDLALSRGFMVANNNLNIRGDDANDVVSAEALMMLKEHIAETYGSIRYTIGAGCSGGSIQQYLIAADYPGLLDGIQPNCSFQDSWTTANEVNDCHLLLHYFGTHPGVYSTAQQAAVMGTHSTGVCLAWDASFAPVGIPSRAANCNLSGADAAVVYNASTNPTGVRCTVQDYQSAIWGFRPSDGFARSPYANVGLQYGLAALNAGTITPEQFVALNEGVGGTDIDLNFTAARTAPDLVAQSIAHRTGQVTQGTQLANVPIIDLRGSEHLFNDIHTDYHSYVMRARLDAANGGHGNQLIWTWEGAIFNIVPPATVALKSFLTMDAWLATIESDQRDVPLSQKVLDDKPTGAVDECFMGATLTESTDAVACNAAFPYFADARLVAGSPWTDNATQCSLQPLDRASYSVAFTDAQWARLQAAFPDGVCDWSAPPVGFQPSVPWLTFAGGPGGEPVGPAPESHPGSANH